MKKRVLLFAAMMLLLAASALASEPAVPADEALVAALLPGYTLLEGHDCSDGLRLLMQRPDGETVFVGAVQDERGGWTLSKSAPLPAGSILGVENFVNSLGIPTETYYDIVSVAPMTDGTWCVSMVMADDGVILQMGRGWISDGVHPVEGIYGDHPFEDIATADWARLPDSMDEALAMINSTDWAVVHNPNPADRLHLRSSASRKSASMGKYYNGTPVRVLSAGINWSYVEILGVRGYMMNDYLNFGKEMQGVAYAGPWLHAKEERTPLYDDPAAMEAFCMLEDGERFYVVGIVGEEWYHIWLPDAGIGAYIRQDALWEGNG
ncbi:MAG: hypothetical protein J6K32_00970 [Clostridia bacterium]|nr:hypothetical protein [Clostridia bacterium]